jgi:segregation and condensation protein B
MAQRRNSDGDGGEHEGAGEQLDQESVPPAPPEQPDREGTRFDNLPTSPGGRGLDDLAETASGVDADIGDTGPVITDFDRDEKTDPGAEDVTEVVLGAAPSPPASEAQDEVAGEIPGAAVGAEDEGGQVLDFARAQDDAASTESEQAGNQARDDSDEEGELARVPFEQLEPLLEALLFASDRPLSLADLKRMSGERDSRLLNQALEALIARRQSSGVQVVSVASAYSLRTNPRFGEWVSRLVAAKPVRLSRAMLETLAIVAYRQPITRPEMDDVRGVDCGPVLKTLLDRNLVRIIGKREEVGRPMLYGTTPEFLRIFSLKDLTQLPTLRQFHELSAEHQAKVDEAHPVVADAMGIVGGAAPLEPLATSPLTSEPGEDDDRLIAELEEASEAASRATGPLSPEAPAAEPAKEP